MLKENVMKVIVKKVGEAPKYKNIENTLKTFQSITEGLSQILPVTQDGLIMYCNEEGKLKGLPPNFKLLFYTKFGYYSDTIVGDVVFFRTNGENETDVSEDDLAIVENFTKESY